MGKEKRKCRNCGRLFDSRNENEQYCSVLCRTTALFVGGGGDQRKPAGDMGSKKYKPETSKASDKKVCKRGSDSKYPRVKELFTIPIEKRWEVAKTFNPDEMAYARRLANRMLNEEKMIDELSTWEKSGESEVLPEESTLGESDDGSI